MAQYGWWGPRMDNGGRLHERPVDMRDVGNVRMRRDDYGRAMGLILARGHVLGLRGELRLLVRVVPLGHVLLLIRRRVWRHIVLRVMVLGVGVMDRRVRLWRQIMVLGVDLPASLMNTPGGLWYVRAGHHWRLGSTMPSQSALARAERPTCEAGEAWTQDDGYVAVYATWSGRTRWTVGVGVGVQ